MGHYARRETPILWTQLRFRERRPASTQETLNWRILSKGELPREVPDHSAKRIGRGRQVAVRCIKDARCVRLPPLRPIAVKFFGGGLISNARLVKGLQSRSLVMAERGDTIGQAHKQH